MIAGAFLLIATNWIQLILAASLLIAGSVAILITLLTIPLWVIYTFDKTLGAVQLEHKTLVHSKSVEWRLQDIQSIHVDAEEDSDSTTHYVINLMLTSGQRLQLREITENSEPQEYEAIAEDIRQFLELPN